MHLRIWHKMIIGIAIPSFITLMGGLLTYGYINDVQDRQGYVQIADDVREHISEVRRSEKNFYHFKNAKYLNHIQDAIAVLNDSINNISEKEIEEIGGNHFSILRDSIRKYPNLITALYENYQKETEITEKVRAEGRKLEMFAAKGKHAKELTTSFVLHLRLLEKNYMLFRDNRSFSELNSGLAQIKDASPICFVECNAYIDTVHDLFINYKKSSSLVNEIQINGERLEEIIGKIAVRERKKINSFFTTTKRLLLSVLIVICILGPLLIYKTAGYVVAPIKRLAKITKNIADGDTTLRAPLREHDETYSLAVSFNTMLDQLNLTHQSLEQSMTLLKHKHSQLVESEKRASIGLLVSGVAHELNNPLNNISLITETLIEDLGEQNPRELKNDLHDILGQSHRAHDIVENLLDFARARRSKDMEKLDIVNVVQESIKLVSNQLRVNNISLKMNLPDSTYYVNGNLSKLEQIFINIVVNAVQVMKNKGTLTIDIMPDKENKNILIKVNDTGPGIPKQDLENIFEPFFTTKEVGKGTGLGLSVSHGLVLEHKGKISVESEDGAGTTFIIKFPLDNKAV